MKIPQKQITEEKIAGKIKIHTKIIEGLKE